MDFNIVHQLYKDDIFRLSRSLTRNIANYRVEQDDLIQEANIKLWQLSKNGSFTGNKSKILISIKNHLLDYVKLCKKDALREAISIEEIELK